MADVLKSLPFLTMEEYLWGFSSAYIRLMAYDQSRVKYLSNKEVERRRAQKENERNAVFTASDVMKKLGIGNIPQGGSSGGSWIEKLTRNNQVQEETKQ